MVAPILSSTKQGSLLKSLRLMRGLSHRLCDVASVVAYQRPATAAFQPIGTQLSGLLSGPLQTISPIVSQDIHIMLLYRLHIMIIMQVVGVRLKSTAGNVIPHNSYLFTQKWLSACQWHSAMETVIAESKESCEEMLKSDLSRIISYSSLSDAVLPECFEFKASVQEINNGRFWPTSGAVHGKRISL